MHVYAYMGLRIHAKVPETMKGKFFSIKCEVWNESHIIWKLFQTPFFQHINPYMVAFQNTTENPKESIRFIGNSESKREFFTKHPQVNIFLIEAFSVLDLGVLRLLITSLFDCE